MFIITKNEKNDIDRCGMRWQKAVETDAPYYGQKDHTEIRLKFTASLLNPTILIETDEHARHLGRSKCRRCLLPLEHGCISSASLSFLLNRKELPPHKFGRIFRIYPFESGTLLIRTNSEK